MASLQVDILNPKAGKILKDLADLNLISIREIEKKDNFLKIVKRLRTKAKNSPISLSEISKEVETVRAKRYAKAKR
jgi:trehalose-6-phosphate synthase